MTVKDLGGSTTTLTNTATVTDIDVPVVASGGFTLFVRLTSIGLNTTNGYAIDPAFNAARYVASINQQSRAPVVVASVDTQNRPVVDT